MGTQVTRGVENPRGVGDSGGPGNTRTSHTPAHRTAASGNANLVLLVCLFTAPPPAQGTRTKAQLTQGGDKEEKGQR